MYNNLRLLIEKTYDFHIKNVIEAPRQFVAETYVMETDSNEKYFCKVIKKQLFIPHTIESLPVVKNIHDLGFERLNFPIPTTDNLLYVMDKSSLLILFNFIDAPHSYKYSNYEFGKLIAGVHKITNKVTSLPKQEQFIFRYGDNFWGTFESLTNYKGNDKVSQKLQTLLTKYIDELRHDYTKFLELSKILSSKSFDMVITHGDPAGNVLAKTATDLYLVDWDDVLLSPPERDTWFLHHDQDFMKGYKSVFPNYQINAELSRYFTYKRYFEDLMEYFAEISDTYTKQHRLKNLQALEDECFEGWLRPSIRKFDPIEQSK